MLAVLAFGPSLAAPVSSGVLAPNTHAGKLEEKAATKEAKAADNAANGHAWKTAKKLAKAQALHGEAIKEAEKDSQQQQAEGDVGKMFKRVLEHNAQKAEKKEEMKDALHAKQHEKDVKEAQKVWDAEHASEIAEQKKLDKAIAQDKPLAEKGRALRNGDPKWQSSDDLCMVTLANCADGRIPGKTMTMAQCHDGYTKCHDKAVASVQQDKETADAAKEAEAAAQQAEKERWNAIEKEDPQLAEEGRALRNGDNTFQAPDEKCKAKLANCRDQAGPFADGKKHTMEECHDVYTACLDDSATESAKPAKAQALHGEAIKEAENGDIW